jgi:transcriptional regulator with XRE-family HTH domain
MASTKELIEQLRQLRVSSGVHQVDLAEMSGYDRSAIARLETHRLGKRGQNPKLNTIIDLADVLGYELVLQPKK